MAFQMTDYSVLDGSQMDSYSGNIPLSNFPGDSMALGQEYSLRQSIVADAGVHFGVAALTFDNVEELLWSGNQGGHLTSFFSSELQKYTSFDVDLNSDIRQIVTIDGGVLSLTSSILRLSGRRGLTLFNLCSEHLQNMQCMTLTQKGTLLLGGHHSNLIEIDLETCDEISFIQVRESNCAILRNHPRFICSGDIRGKVSLHDHNTLRVEHVIECHSGMLSDFDVHGNYLITCGFSAGLHDEYTADAFLMVYDIRMMRSVTPIQMMFPPFLLRFMTAYTSRLCVVSQTGQFQLVDTGNSDQYALFIHQVDTASANITSFATSSSCQALAFGDEAGYLHLYAASDQAQFNAFSRPTEFADSVEPLHPIDINDELTPLSSIPLPHCPDKLLSDWPEEWTQKVYRPTPSIDPQILSSIKMVASIGYAPNIGNRLRNQVPYQLNKNSTRGSPVLKDDDSEKIPHRYLKVEIKYTRTGLDDIDFNKYNCTSFSGLEANLPNSYCNNMLQVLYFIEPLRCALVSHLCQKEFCLSCELGFLFHMLDTAQGLPCQANNFLRAFRTIPEASALGLIITDLTEAKKRGNLPTLVQSWTRFMLQQIHTETLGTPDNGMREDPDRTSDCSNQSIMNKLFGAKQFSCNRCRCNSETCQETTTLLSSLVYPNCHPINKPPVQYSFAEVLKKSLAVEQNITAWCEKCNRFQSMVQTRVLRSLPDILVLSCGLDNKQDVKFWETQLKLLGGSKEQSVMKVLPDVLVTRKKACRYGSMCKRSDCIFYHEYKNSGNTKDSSNTMVSWIPLGLKIKLVGGEIDVEDHVSKIDNGKVNQDDNDKTVDENVESAEYELTAVISVIIDTQDSGNDNIISCIKVGPSGHIRHKGSSAAQWYLFNDFTIVRITPEEAVYLNFEWKLPSVLYFSRIDLDSQHDLTVFNPVEEQVFRDDVSLARSGQSHITFTPLTSDDQPKAGQLVAIDAEFVTLNQEEAEIRSDGTRSTIRPSQFSVARISCVRGEGPLEGVPFIDDYISTQEQVVDYATKFSGIQPGDLDAAISSKHLTTLKSTYQKLRFLVDNGVMFIGHGLKNDFRVINLVVPPEQMLDTVYLFQLPNKRFVSLRFLAWHFLGLKIQSETHDSIEDAKTAFQLYKKYVELKQKGELTKALKELYDVGRTLQWKVPGIDD